MHIYLIEADKDYLVAKYRATEDFFKVISHWNKKLVAPPDQDFCPEMVYDFSWNDDLLNNDIHIVTDFVYCLPLDALILSARAVRALEPLLLQSGTIYNTVPTSLLSDTVPMDYKLFRCTRQVDAVDIERSEQRPSLPSDGYPIYARFAFKADMVRSVPIFRPDRVFDLFVGEAFVETVERERLSGLQVMPVWSEADGPLQALQGRVNNFPPYPPGIGSMAEKQAAMLDWMAGRRARQPGWW